MRDAASTISIQAFRYDPDRQQERHLQSYEVESTEPLSVMALLAKIHEMDVAVDFSQPREG